MSAKGIDDGGPAFPVPEYINPDGEKKGFSGMTLRDWFAGNIISEIAMRDIRRFQSDSGGKSEDFTVNDEAYSWQDAAAESYAIADAMLAARAKRRSAP